MRATAGYLACLAAMVSVTAWPSEPSPIYVRGYYTSEGHNSLWQHSDSSPWYVVKGAPWADPRLLEWGYVPVTHNAQSYYCLSDRARTGSRVPVWICGDPATVELLYDSNRSAVELLYGRPH